jgi:hypothetical protein
MFGTQIAEIGLNVFGNDIKFADLHLLYVTVEMSVLLPVL